MAEFSPLDLGFEYHYTPDVHEEAERLLLLWKLRVKSYFPDLYKKALKYHLNDDENGVKVFENDGAIFEVTINTGNNVATARLCSQDEN